MPNIMGPRLAVLSILGYWVAILGTVEGQEVLISYGLGTLWEPRSLGGSKK